MSLDLGEIELLAASSAYAGLTALSNESAALINCAIGLLSDLSSWSGGYSLSDSDKDKIAEMVATLISEVQLGIVGGILMYATSSAPGGTLRCDGTQYLRVDYPELYAVLDAAFIVDADTFATPDLSGRVPRGQSSDAIGDTSGSDTVTIATGNLPAHSHGYSFPTLGAIIIGAGAPIPAYVPPALPLSTGSTGSGSALNVVPTNIIINFAIVSGRP